MKTISMEWMYYKEDIKNLSSFINLIKEQSKHFGMVQGQIVKKKEKYNTIFIPDRLYKFNINEYELLKLKRCFILSISKPDFFNTTILVFSDNDDIENNEFYIKFMREKEKYLFVTQLIDPSLYLNLFIYEKISVDNSYYIYNFEKMIDIWWFDDRSVFSEYIRGKVDLNFIEFFFDMKNDLMDFCIYSVLRIDEIAECVVDPNIGYFYRYRINCKRNPKKEVRCINENNSY